MIRRNEANRNSPRDRKQSKACFSSGWGRLSLYTGVTCLTACRVSIGPPLHKLIALTSRAPGRSLWVVQLRRGRLPLSAGRAAGFGATPYFPQLPPFPSIVLQTACGLGRAWETIPNALGKPAANLDNAALR